MRHHLQVQAFFHLSRPTGMIEMTMRNQQVVDNLIRHIATMNIIQQLFRGIAAAGIHNSCPPVHVDQIGSGILRHAKTTAAYLVNFFGYHPHSSSA